MDNTVPKTLDLLEAEELLRFYRNSGIDDAIIAGGCVRDYVCGLPIKDIDVFCSRQFSDAVEQIDGVSKDLICAYQNIPDVDCVWNMAPLSGGTKPVQIIAMEGEMTPIERIGTFDWGICQIWYDGEIKYTDHFLNDFHNKTMTLVYCENQHEWDRSMARAERLREKFTDYTIVAPARNTYPSSIKDIVFTTGIH